MPQDINAFLVSESGRINYDIYTRYQHASPWISQPRKVAWPEGMGETIDNIMWERPYIANDGTPTGAEELAALGADSWGAMGFSAGGDTGNCIPPVDNVKFSQTLRRTSLYQKAIHSPKFCVTDLLYAGKREAQMRAVEWGLGDMVRLYWVRWNRDGFTKWARKYVAEGSLTNYTDESDDRYFPPVAPTSRLTNGILDHFYNLLMLEQGYRHSVSTQNGRPIYGLITDQFTSRFLIRGDDAIREDFRYAEPDKLLTPLGVTHTYNGFIHMIDDMPPRFNFNAALASDSGSEFGASDYTDPWTEVPPHIFEAQEDGSFRKEVNPAWLTAEYQDSYIYVKDAYQLRVPGSITSVSRAKFDPQKFMGDFFWQNQINLDTQSEAYNPDGTIGRFRAVMKAGVEAINPHVMFVIRHKVCGADLNLTLCEGESA